MHYFTTHSKHKTQEIGDQTQLPQCHHQEVVNMKIYTTITPEPTTTTTKTSSTTPLSSSSISSQEHEELPSSSAAAVVVVMTPPSSPPLPTRKRPHIEASSSCKPDDDDEDKKSTPRPSSIITTTTTSPSSRHNNKRQRTQKKNEEPTTTTNVVRFAPTPHQTHIIPRWTTNESTNSWYSKHDIFTFKYQESVDASTLRQLIQETPTIHDLPQESAVYRGLERLLSESIACEISDRRNLCVLNVLVAQLQGFDVEGIAQASMDCTEKAVAWALTLGSI